MIEQTVFENMTIVNALIQIIRQALNSQLSDDFWKNCETHLNYLRSQLGLTNFQILFVSILVERSCAMSCDDFASYLNITAFEVRTHGNELDELVNKKWVTQEVSTLRDEIEYKLAPEVATALVNNQVFVPTDVEPDVEDFHNNAADDDYADDEYDFYVGDTDDRNDSNDNNDAAADECTLFRCRSHEEIQKKSLFFNPSEQQQIERLTKLLGVKKFGSIQSRLEKEGMRKGFACLFYGGPGTGKTETVLQIARQTGRDVLQVDMSMLRSKWVGESEKNISNVFAYYRYLCDTSEVMPILFFNEADAIISKRKEDVESSVDKMENTMQNIILQEMEDLDGILISTTNLMCNFDSAFERRFLYKIEFHKPELAVKARIWKSMLKKISKKDAYYLATQFDLSGGQIENVARKRTVNYVLTGKYATLNEIEDFCRTETLGNSQKPYRIAGFSAYTEKVE